MAGTTSQCAPRTRLAVAALATMLATAATARGQGQDFFWQSSGGGLFQNEGNWDPGSVPGILDTARFNLSAPFYAVNFDADITNAALVFLTDTVTFDLAGFTYTLTGGFIIGGATDDISTVTFSGGSLSVSAPAGVVVANNEGSFAEMTLTGQTTSLTAGDLQIGGSGLTTSQGFLNIEAGATVTVTSTIVYIARQPNNIGTITVTGLGSTLDVNTSLGLKIGDRGTGTFNVLDGAVVTTTSAALAPNTGASATVLVSGADSAFNIDGPFEMGLAGNALMTIDAGGLVGKTDPDPYVVGPLGVVDVVNGGVLSTGGSVTPGGLTTLGTGPGGTATVTVSGIGSRWDIFGPVSLGESGAASLTIDAGGLVGQKNPDPYVVGPLGVVDVVNGGVLSTGGSVTPGGLTTLGTGPGGTATVTVSGIGSRWDIFGPVSLGESGAASLTIDAGGLVGKRNPEEFLPIDVGSLGTVTGVGTLAGTVLSSGTFAPGVGAGAPSFASRESDSRTGTGDVRHKGWGTDVVPEPSSGPSVPHPSPSAKNGAPGSGTFAPGSSAGVLTVDGEYTQFSDGLLMVELGGTLPGSEHDVLQVTQAATLGGTLDIQLINGFIPAMGQSFEVVTALSLSGGFDAVTGLDLGGVMSFETRFDATGLTLIASETQGLVIEPGSATLDIGASVKLSAKTVLASGGSANASAEAVWSSDDPLIASVDASGWVTGEADGMTTIRATFQGFSASRMVVVGTVSDIPAVGEWGLMVLMMFMLTAATLIVRRRAQV